MEKNKVILLLIGASGSGKSTIADLLEEKYGLKVLRSYTDRPMRPNDKSHTFITKEEFSKIPSEDMVAYTFFNGYDYCSTKEQVENSDIYVIDEIGVKNFIKTYTGNKRVITIRISANEETCKKRMLERGDSPTEVHDRLVLDKLRYSDIYVDCIVHNEDGKLDEAAYKVYDKYIDYFFQDAKCIDR